MTACYVPVKVTVKRPGLQGARARRATSRRSKGKRQRHSPRANRAGVGAALASPIPVRRRHDSRLRGAVQGQGQDGRSRWSRWRWTQQRWDWRGISQRRAARIRSTCGSSRPTSARKSCRKSVRSATSPFPPMPRRGRTRGSAYPHARPTWSPAAISFGSRSAAATRRQRASRSRCAGFQQEGTDDERRRASRAEDPEGVFLPAGIPAGARDPGADDRAGLQRRRSGAVFAEVYDTTGGRAHTIDVSAVLRSEAGDVTPVGISIPLVRRVDEERRHAAIRCATADR